MRALFNDRLASRRHLAALVFATLALAGRAEAQTFTVSGRIADLNDSPLAGVLVTIGGSVDLSATTDASGAYSVVLPDSGSYTVTPTKDAFTFAPASTVVPGQPSDVAAHFVATSGSYVRYFAEGATGPVFDTSFALLNASGAVAETTLRFARSDGVVITRELRLASYQRATVEPRTIPGLEHAAFSTTIEATQPVIADRTMRWRQGAHAEAAVETPRTTWYLAEGATTGAFELFYLLHNPSTTATTVEIRYLFAGGASSLTREYLLAPSSRRTVWVNVEHAALADAEVSAIVRSLDSVPIVVERAMYQANPLAPSGLDAGHVSAGVAEPALQWFLAEGTTGAFFDTFVLIENPGAATALVEAQYLKPDGTTVTRLYAIGPLSRHTVWVDTEPGLADTAVSTVLRSLNAVPIIVERASWWGQHGRWTESHGSAGAVASGTKWAIAGGEAGGPLHAETFALIANPSDTAGVARVTLVFEDGGRIQQDLSLAAHSRTNVAMPAQFPATLSRSFGIVVESIGASPVEIVVERATYTDSVDASGARTTWGSGTSTLATRLR